jgi:hypothetical protein
MVHRTIACVFVCASFLVADELVLRSGRRVEGTYLGGDARKVRMAVADAIESFEVSEIAQITFAAAPAEPASAPKPASAAVAATPAATATREAPAGTALVIRMIDDVDSERDQLGQTFRASVDEAVMVDGQTIIPRGADVTVKLVDDKQSGKLTGRTELTLDIQTLTVDGRTVDVKTQEVTQASQSRTGSTTRNVGGGAALGAIIGAIAGGGKGAAIGAVAGAGAGGAVQVLTKGQKVKIPSETRLTFTLQQPVRL